MAAVAIAAASVTPAAAADAATVIEHDPVGAGLSGSEVSADRLPLVGPERSGTVTAPQDPTDAGAANGEDLQVPPAATVTAEAATVGWWDGTGALTEAAPAIAAQGRCAALGDGWFVLFGSGSLSTVCNGVDGSFTGSPVGVGWVAGLDAEGPYVEVWLVGAADVGRETYRGFGELDVIFDGGAFAAGFAGCEHRAAAGWSSCRTLVTGATVPPGSFVGVGTVGIQPPASRTRSPDDEPVTPAAQRAALVALYNSTDGANWRRNANWNTTAPVADWYGVTTDNNGSITRLYLDSNSLSGSIPTEIGDLTNLTSLWLPSNSLSGSIPAEIGDLANLTSLLLYSNKSVGVDPNRDRRPRQPQIAVAGHQQSVGVDPC